MTLSAPPPNVASQPLTSTDAFLPQPEDLRCPGCDTDVTPLCADALARAQQQLSDLEAQVRLLNQKATAAVDKWADYEDELHNLRRQLEESKASSRTQTPVPTPTASRFSFLSPRKQPSSLPTPQHSPHQSQSTSTTSLSPNIASTLLPPPAGLLPPPLPEKDAPTRQYPNPLDLASAEISDLTGKLSAVQQALRHETLLRQQAEEKALAGGRELEDLTSSLFEEANKMVSVERREKAKLEERLAILEERDKAKRDSLKMLEGAIVRIERVRSMVGPSTEDMEKTLVEEPVVVKKGRVIGRKSEAEGEDVKTALYG